MSDSTKLQATHLQRTAIVYVRQSSAAQVEHNRESTQRQYALVERALALGWQRDQISVIDDDLGMSGASSAQRLGFARLTTEVALKHVGIVLGLEVSRLARNNADWYRLLDLCGMTDTLIGDGDGIYHPALFNDRLVLGLKGTMSEAELHILRARLEGGIRNKAARGELRRALPVGFMWGEQDGEVLLHPDASVVAAIGSVFERFAELGSARQVWLWFRSQALCFPLQTIGLNEIRWVHPTYAAIHKVLRSPVYAGAYVYGKSRVERFVNAEGGIGKRLRRLPRAQWSVVIPKHHEGYIDWATYEANQKQLAGNIHPQSHQGAGAVREGSALLQGLGVCGHCGRRLHTHYRGNFSAPGYHCPGKTLVEGRGHYCLNIGGVQIDQAVAKAVLEALTPAALQASLKAAEQLHADHDSALAQWRLALERARYEAERAERRYRNVEPENRLVARGLEAEWEKRLREAQQAQSELTLREQQRACTLDAAQGQRIALLGMDLKRVWAAPTTEDRDRKQLLRALLDDVIIAVKRDEHRAHLTLRWRSGTLTDLEIELPRRQAAVRTDEDTIELIRRLAAHYPDATIAAILNRQGRKSAYEERFTAVIVSSLRRTRQIPCYQPAAQPTGELLNIKQAAQRLNVAPSTIHRWLAEGCIAGEQLTPGAPWKIRISEQLRARFVEQAPAGYLPMLEATKRLRVSRQTVLQRVKRGELEAVHVCQGRRKGLRIKVVSSDPDLFT
jgi:DNA invertase Pin-like site-specific DNA recombinase/transposase